MRCARTGKYTLITCHPKRGREGIDAAGVLGRFRGMAVHDAWAPYDSYADAEHQLRRAHALREPQGVADTATGAEWCWATQLADALVAMRKLAADAIAAGAETIDPTRSISGFGSTATRSNPLIRKHNALARRLLDRQDDYLRFTHDWRIPPDNNGSKRDIRMIKLRQKISSFPSTLTGAKQFRAIRSYLSTAAKYQRLGIR